MQGRPYYERMLETAGLIARHADFPGKREMVDAAARSWTNWQAPGCSPRLKERRSGKSWWPAWRQLLSVFDWLDDDPCATT